MKITRVCHGCKQEFRKDEMLQYSTLSGKTTYWFCPNCYEEKLAREKFSYKVCSIFGIKSPGPLIWSQRKYLQNKYGYTDDIIIDCLDYMYKVCNKKVLKESLGLVNPKTVFNMKAWQASQKAQASSIAAAIAHTEMKESVVKIKENNTTRPEINLADGLFDD